jgi:hypothetical protein
LEFQPLTPQQLAFCKNLSANDRQKLPFRKPVFPEVDNARLVEQSQLYSLAKDKLPSWWERADLIFPDRVALEQCSSELLACWKSQLIEPGLDHLIDVCAGLGVDSFFLGTNTRKLTAYEADGNRARFLQYNMERLRPEGVVLKPVAFEVSALEDINFDQERFLIYADPDRRSAEGQRLSYWKDTRPSVHELHSFLRNRPSVLLVKLSPMDDPDEILEALPGADAVWIASVSNEVKEVLIRWDFRKEKALPVFRVVDINKKGQYAEVEIPREIMSYPSIGIPSPNHYLLDPWAGIRKGKSAMMLASAKKWTLLSKEARLFANFEEPLDFPGRVFLIERVFESLAEFSRQFKSKGLHVVSRNFPQSADDIRKKYKWEESGDQFLFCFENSSGRKSIVLTRRLENRCSPNFRKQN